LNEHFLALKNKFNNEKDELEKFAKGLEDEIKREEISNKSIYYIVLYVCR
jgi:hypothetical protein